MSDREQQRFVAALEAFGSLGDGRPTIRRRQAEGPTLPNAQHYGPIRTESVTSAHDSSSTGTPVDAATTASVQAPLPHHRHHVSSSAAAVGITTTHHNRTPSFGVQSSSSLYRTDAVPTSGPYPPSGIVAANSIGGSHYSFVMDHQLQLAGPLLACASPDHTLRDLLMHGPASSVMHVSWNPHRWMTDISEALRYRRLNQIRMVGSHDAGTYRISPKSEFGPDAPVLLRKKKWGCVSAVVKKCAKPITHGWAKTQQLSVEQQLLRGVRYLDLRAARSDEDGKFYVTHSLMSLPFTDVVAQIASFMSGEFRNPKDVLIMDIQHLFGVDLQNVDMCKSFFAELEPLEDLFFPPYLTPDSLMDEVWSTPYRILLCVGRDMAFCPAYVHRRPEVLHSPWHNCNSKQALMDRLLGELQSDLGRANAQHATLHPTTDGAGGTPPTASASVGRSPTGISSGASGSGANGVSCRGLYVTQAVISPYVSDIVKSIVPLLPGTARSIRDYAERFNSMALRWFRDVNLSQVSRQEILSETVRERHQADADELGVIWHHDVINTHANVLMLDYIEDGLCEWFTASEDGTDPTGEQRCAGSSSNRACSPAKSSSLRRRSVAGGSSVTQPPASSSGSPPLNRERLPASAPTSAAWKYSSGSNASSAMVDAVTLCVYINIHLYRIHLLRGATDGASNSSGEFGNSARRQTSVVA